MNHKRKSSKRRISRKMFSPARSVKEWSRMLHKWWKRDVLDKEEFKRNKHVS